MPYVSGTLYDGRIGVHRRPLSMNRWSISVQRLAFLCNEWRFCATNGVSVQRMAFLCNEWRFCATNGVSVQQVAFLCNKWGVRFAHQFAHKQFGGM
jgi:hypothetical protein